MGERVTHIACCVDGSEASKLALEHAVRLRDQLGAQQLDIVHIVPPAVYFGVYYPPQVHGAARDAGLADHTRRADAAEQRGHDRQLLQLPAGGRNPLGRARAGRSHRGGEPPGRVSPNDRRQLRRISRLSRDLPGHAHPAGDAGRVAPALPRAPSRPDRRSRRPRPPAVGPRRAWGHRPRRSVPCRSRTGAATRSDP